MKQNPYFPYARQNSDALSSNLQYPPPAYRHASPTAALCVPTAPWLSIPQITNVPGSSSSYHGFCSSAEQQERRALLSTNPHPSPLPNQSGLSFQNAAESSASVSGLLPLRSGDPSQSPQSAVYSGISISHSSSVESNTTTSVFNIPPRTPYCMESMKQNEIPHSGSLEQTSLSPLKLGAPKLSRHIESNPALLSGPVRVQPFPLMSIEQGPSASLSTESAPEDTMTVQQSEPLLVQQNCPVLPVQGKHPVQNASLALYAGAPPGQNALLPWQHGLAPPVQVKNNLQSSQDGSSETSQLLCNSNQACNIPHSAIVDYPQLVPPYPPPQIPRHTSPHSGKSNLQHSFGPFHKHLFQNTQPLPLVGSSNHNQSASPDMKPAALSHAHSTSLARSKYSYINSEKPKEDSGSWMYGNFTQKTTSKVNTEDRSRSDRSNTHPRSWSHSSGLRSSRYRSHRQMSNPKECDEGDKPSVSHHSRHHNFRRSTAGFHYSHNDPCWISRARKNYHAESKTKPRDDAKSCTIVKEPSRKNSLSLEDRELKKDEKKQVEHCHEIKNECTSENSELQQCSEEIEQLEFNETIEHKKNAWSRSSPSDLFYQPNETNRKFVRSTMKLKSLAEDFIYNNVERKERVTAGRPHLESPPRENHMKLPKCKSKVRNNSSSSSDESSADESYTMKELKRKQTHPYRLHPEAWHNDPGELNTGPLCGCNPNSRRHGICHGIYAGETHLEKCDPETNNADRLFHYCIMISPPTNFLTKMPTVIKHDDHEFIFEGFSMFSHAPLDVLPNCKFIRFSTEYTILCIEENPPVNFTILELDLFFKYLFHEILELVDLDFRAQGDKDGCPNFHFMPRFVRELPENGKEILSMNEVIRYLLVNSNLVYDEKQLPALLKMSESKLQKFANQVNGMIVTNPGMKPCSLRVDRLDRNQPEEGESNDLEIVHFGVRPLQLRYMENTDYQKALKEYNKLRDVLANIAKPLYKKQELKLKKKQLEDMRAQLQMKPNVVVTVSAKGFYHTGIACDIVQHALLIPVLVSHIRFHWSCDVLEKEIGYKFKDRLLLQLALTQSSYRENYGTNPDHVKNSLINCGIRGPEYGARQIHYANTKKRGVNVLINTMSHFGTKNETESNFRDNERLEFLGDTVLKFLSSLHLFLMFPDLEEGGMSEYRAAIVENAHLNVLAESINLGAYMLYAHAEQLRNFEQGYMKANCFEALMGALYLDGGIKVADKVFGEIFLKNDQHIINVWTECPPHPLQAEEPEGDRNWIPKNAFLQMLTKFEESIGVEFKHIRLLARAFTVRSRGYTWLAQGSNQRLEFLGDAVLELIVTEYLYKHFPEHHEGHLTMLRSCLVSNKTLAVICNDVGMAQYAMYGRTREQLLSTKECADLVEAFLGALYLDQDMERCQVFCNVCLFPRLQQFIKDGDWSDPKSKLTQCCHAMHLLDGKQPNEPVYKVLESRGPPNKRVYTVAVYFRGSRLAKAMGPTIHIAEMNAAKKALELSDDLFPKLDFQKKAKTL